MLVLFVPQGHCSRKQNRFLGKPHIRNADQRWEVIMVISDFKCSLSRFRWTVKSVNFSVLKIKFNFILKPSQQLFFKLLLFVSSWLVTFNLCPFSHPQVEAVTQQLMLRWPLPLWCFSRSCPRWCCSSWGTPPQWHCPKPHPVFRLASRVYELRYKENIVRS